MRSAITVFVALFLAELGDKTQLAVISFVVAVGVLVGVDALRELRS